MHFGVLQFGVLQFEAYIALASTPPPVPELERRDAVLPRPRIHTDLKPVVILEARQHRTYSARTDEAVFEISKVYEAQRPFRAICGGAEHAGIVELSL